jgi:signal transduction histidine kinase
MATDFSKFPILDRFIGAKGLLRQFAIAASVMILLGMTITGAWLTNQIQDGVIHHTMLSTAVFIERYIQPLIVELRTKDRFSDAAIENLDRQVKQGLIAKQLLSIKIWKPDGTVVFSTAREIIGQKFAVEDALKTAVDGQIGIEYGELLSLENKYERALNKKLIEIYVPMFDLSNGKIFAVSELYVDADTLPDDLQQRYVNSWIVVGLVTLAMLLPLFFIVRRGDKTINSQDVAIANRMAELTSLLSENRELNSKVEQANRESANVNERFLNRLGADLHDGPVQMLAVAVLCLDNLASRKSRSSKSQKLDEANVSLVRSTINDALREVRLLATGLVLPELARCNLEDTLRLVIDAHIMRTRSSVDLECKSLPKLHSSILNDNIYRFVQEGLSNSYRHASGQGQKVTAKIKNNVLIVEVSDAGKGFIIGNAPSLPLHLGLSGMRSRIIAIGGEFEIISGEGSGTILRARIPIESFAKQFNDAGFGTVDA